jgi:hypothetical protein
MLANWTAHGVGYLWTRTIPRYPGKGKHVMGRMARNGKGKASDPGSPLLLSPNLARNITTDPLLLSPNLAKNTTSLPNLRPSLLHHPKSSLC